MSGQVGVFVVQSQHDEVPTLPDEQEGSAERSRVQNKFDNHEADPLGELVSVIGAGKPIGYRIKDNSI